MVYSLLCRDNATCMSWGQFWSAGLEGGSFPPELKLFNHSLTILNRNHFNFGHAIFHCKE